MKKQWTRLAALLTAACLVVMSVSAYEGAVDDAHGVSTTLGDSSNPEKEEPTLGASDVRPCEGVVIPTDFSLTIDPFQVSGREQVYSGFIRVINNNDFPVEVELSGLCVTANDPAVIVRDVPVSSSSLEKEIQLSLRCLSGRGFDEEVPILESAAKPMRFTLGASDGKEILPADWGVTLGASGGILSVGRSQAVFKIVGSVSAMPLEEWRAGDVTVSMTFAAQPMPGFEPMEMTLGDSGQETEPEIELPVEEDEEEPDDSGELTIGSSGID